MSYRHLSFTLTQRQQFLNPFLQHNLTFATQNIKCWKCGIERTNLSELFCAKCSHIQSPLERSNYFKVLNIDERFEVDLKELTQKYRSMQSQLHPDKFSNKSNEEKNISEEFSSLVNKAYSTLQTPLKRALHLLYLKGDSIKENQTLDTPEFLMEIMELNEEVENATTNEKLKNLKAKNDHQLHEVSNKIKNHFNKNEIQEAKDSIIKMKYYNSLSVRINNLMREKGIVE